MNKKENLNGLIEKGKLQIEDGIVINLDTGFIFGGAINPAKNSFAEELNEIMDHACRTQKDKYKLFEKLLRSQIENHRLKQLAEKIKFCLDNTQLYSFYNENQTVLSFAES